MWSLAFVLLFLATVPARAQFRTSIQGTVTDPTGAVIPGATLTLTDIGTNETRTTTSDPVGVFNFNALPADHFNLTVVRDGFQQKVLNNLQLIPEQANAVNVQLEIGVSTQTVTVDASTVSALDTETVNNGQTVTENEIQHMPVFERDATSLIQLAPGTLADGSHQGSGNGFQAPGTQSGASSGGGGNLGNTSSIFATENGPSANTNGNQFENNGFNVDGISTVSAVWGGATIITPSEDSIGSIQILTDDYDAEDGRFDGAMTKITSKSGSNEFHGSLFAEINRPGLNAYQRWNGPGSVVSVGANGQELTPDQRGLLRDTDRYNQFGGSVGGPIWKDRLFFFFNYEGQNENTAATSTGWYTTSALDALAPSGSIASTILNYKGGNVLGTVITGATCATASIPAGNCQDVTGGLNIGSPLTSGLGNQDLSYVSASNPGVGNGLSTTADIAQYTLSSPTSTDFKQYNGRLDADVTQNDHLSFAIYWVPDTLTFYNGGYGYDLFHHSQVNDAFSLIWNHTFSPTFLNEARANAAGWRYNELTSNPQAPFGLPQDSVTTIGNIGLGGLSVGAPGVYDQWTYSYKDVATKVLSTHTMKFGFELTRLYYLNDPVGKPNYTFYNLWDFINDAPEAEGGPFQATTGIPGGYRNDNREDVLGIFYQDSWKVRPSLTITAGLRWSYFGPMDDKDDHMGVLTFGSGTSLLSGITLRTGIDAWTAPKGNFGPEVGFNWAPEYLKSKFVVRGGFGLNYNGEQIANANNYDGNPPGTSSVPGSSKSPTQINPNIYYAVSSSPTNIFGYPANKSAITTFFPAGSANAGLPTGGNANLGGLPGHMPTQYVEHFSLNAEYDFGHAVVANLGYEGGVGRHEMYNYDATALGDIMGAAQNPLVNSVNTFGSNGWSSNNMMLAGLKHQFSHTFYAEGQFTWAHSMDTNSGPYSRDPYLYNPGYSYGRSAFDVNHTFKVFGTWQPVIFHGKNNRAEKAIGGWSLSGIATFHSGFGWTPYYQAPHQFYCSTCNYGYLQLRPSYLGGAGSSTSNDAFKTGSNFPGYQGTAPILATTSTGTDNNLFSNALFSIPDFSAAITDGQAPFPATSSTTYIPAPGIDRNVFPGPGYRDVDMTFGKAFGLPKMRVLGENANLEIKANLLNIFNLLNINPDTINSNIDARYLGQATGALGARVVDFQARFSF
ncbi:MAG: carboxypeptidase regulatory-like domain-containing protein [Terracidiphilus sp.]